VSENRVLRRIFGWKRDGMRGDWIKLRSEELHDLNPFLISVGGVRLSPLGTSATVGLLYQPRMMMITEQSVE
jgi:hypothetical protein